MLKIAELLKRRDALVADLPERHLAAVDAEIAAAKAEEQAAEAAKHAAALVKAGAERDAAEAVAMDALKALVTALGPLEGAEAALRGLGEIMPHAQSAVTPGLRQAARGTLDWVDTRAQLLHVHTDAERRAAIRGQIAWQEECLARATERRDAEAVKGIVAGIAELRARL